MDIFLKIQDLLIFTKHVGIHQFHINWKQTYKDTTEITSMRYDIHTCKQHILNKWSTCNIYIIRLFQFPLMQLTFSQKQQVNNHRYVCKQQYHLDLDILIFFCFSSVIIMENIFIICS